MTLSHRLRRYLLSLLVAIVGAPAMADGGKLRIGYQKGGAEHPQGRMAPWRSGWRRGRSSGDVLAFRFGWDSGSAELAAIDGAIVERLMRRSGRGATRAT